MRLPRAFEGLLTQGIKRLIFVDDVSTEGSVRVSLGNGADTWAAGVGVSFLLGHNAPGGVLLSSLDPVEPGLLSPG